MSIARCVAADCAGSFNFNCGGLMKKPFLATFALAGVAVVLAACPGDRDRTVTDDPFLDQPPPPAMEPLPPPTTGPMMTDTLMRDTLMRDTLMPGAPGATAP
jgi:hypothetical protein